MPLRRLKKKQKSQISPLMLGGIVVVIFLLRFRSSSGSQNSSSDNPNQTGARLSGEEIASQNSPFVDREEGKEISIQGVVSVSTDSNYTHLLTTYDNIKYGLKSSQVNLDGLQGLVEIQGKIEKIMNALPIIEVKLAQQIKSDGYTKKQGTYLFEKDALIIDKGDKEEITITKTGSDTIVVSSPQGKITIRPFICQKSDSRKNCERMLKDFEIPEIQTLAGGNGQLLYQYPNQSGTRYTFQTENKRGYKIESTNDDLLYEVSSMLSFIDESFIQKNVLNDIKRICLNKDEQLVKVNTFKILPENNKLFVALQGKGNKSDVDCKVQLTLNDVFPLKLAQFTVKNTTHQSASTSPTNTSLTQGEAKTFRFQKGFSITVPQEGIVYQSSLTKENFGLLGLYCTMKVNFAPSKGYNKDDSRRVINNAVIEVYACTSDRDQDQLTNERTEEMIYAGFEKKHFFIRTLNPERKEFAQGMQISL